MGYYTGNGVTSGGGNSIQSLGVLVFNGVHNVWQRIVSVNTKKAGVSLETAKAEQSTVNLTHHIFSWANLYPWTQAKGTRKNATYNQIGDSNLYELNITNETLSCSDNGTTWYS